MKGKARPIYPPNNAPPTPPSELQGIETGPAQRVLVQSEASEDNFDKFSKPDADALLEQGQHILDLPAENVAAAWATWANEANEANVNCKLPIWTARYD